MSLRSLTKRPDGIDERTELLKNGQLFCLGMLCHVMKFSKTRDMAQKTKDVVERRKKVMKE